MKIDFRDLVTTALELVGVACMVSAIALLAGGAWALLAAGVALVALGVMSG